MHHLNEIYLADYGIGIKINGTPDWAKGRGRKAMHPYDDWFNGDKWLLQRPHHFDVSRQTLSKRIRQRFGRSGSPAASTSTLIAGLRKSSFSACRRSCGIHGHDRPWLVSPLWTVGDDAPTAGQRFEQAESGTRRRIHLDLFRLWQ